MGKPIPLAETEVKTGSIRSWIINHDDSWLFVVLYIGLAVVLSIAISLFWLVAVVGVHFALEWMRQSTFKPNGFGHVLSRVLWELKLDIALILFALVLALYMELTMGVVGLGSAARGGLMGGARFLVLQRAIRGILLSLDDLAQVARVVVRSRKRNGEKPVGEAGDEAVQAIEPDDAPSGWRGRWSKGDYITVSFGLICLLLIMAAPLMEHYTLESMLATLASELHPLPFFED
jgi:hypothetical protein